METISLSVSYRPVRFGWCIRQGDKESLRRALLLSHILWGGRYNPLIPVDNEELAQYLIEFFHVDALYSFTEDKRIKNFIEKFPYLPWPNIHKSFFIQGSYEPMATFADIYHPIRRVYENEIRSVQNSNVRIHRYKWTSDDPLYDVFLALFGTFAVTEDIIIDYNQFLKNLPIDEIELSKSKPIPPDSFNDNTINKITSYGLEPKKFVDNSDAGFYIGEVGDFDDLLNFWNLRAADLDVLFFDPKHGERFNLQKDSFLEKLRSRPKRNSPWSDRIHVWSGKKYSDLDLKFIGDDTIRSTVSIFSYNGLNIQQSMKSSKVESLLGTVSDSSNNLSTTFQLPEKPFYDDRYFPNTEKVVVTLHSSISFSFQKTFAFNIPFIPELNEFFARNMGFSWDSLRSQPRGFGLITDVGTKQITLQAISNRNLIKKIFQTYGFEATPSKPGLIALRIIEQMGGLQKCRVFKITGVRDLIESYSYLDSFPRSAAIQKIGKQDPTTAKFDFENFKHLFIEARDKNELHPEDALKFLSKKGVFRVGLKFICPNCQLELWTSIDDLGTMVTCEYCGEQFNVISQLKDRDWAYRKSGLFAKDDHQEGGIPVVVTLQQLDTLLSFQSFIYSTGMNLESPKVPTPEHKCEIDFVLLTDVYGGKPQLVFGECKTRKSITTQDVINLKAVADGLPSDRIDTYIMFAKLAPFTSEEINLCKSAQEEHRLRVIMLSDRELEPYFIYERAREEFEIESTAISLADLAKVTHQLYFNPHPKTK